MLKKNINFTILLIMMLSLFVITGCKQGFDLKVYKATAMIAIESHADTKITENVYTEEGMHVITQIVINGKQAINSMYDKIGVDTERDKTILAIDEVETKGNGLRAGFEDNDKPAHPIWLGYTADNTIIKKGENFSIKLYYAPITSYDIHDPMPISFTEITTERVVYGELDAFGDSYSSSQIDKTVLKNINDFTDKTKFPVAGSNDVAFEIITIPADWFVGERGVFVWRVTVDLSWTYQSPTCEGGVIGLYYRVYGESVILFDNFESFFNYKHH